MSVMIPAEMHPVESSLLESIGYDEEGRKLFIKFHSAAGFVFRYEEVPQEVYDSLRTAPSVGKFFLKEIKGVYPSTKQECV